MSERLLEAFREDAERSTPLPDFDIIEAAGRRRRVRRHALVGAVAACVLGASGLLATAYDDSPGPQPAGDPDGRSRVTPYPTMSMTTLEEGTYELHPFEDPPQPSVRFTLPAGWNSWVGPNRFEGLSERVTDETGANQDALEGDPEWGLGMVALDLRWIAQPSCTMVDVTGEDAATVVDALSTAPRLDVISEPESTTRSGYPAVHLRLREQSPRGACVPDAALTSTDGAMRYLGPGTTYDAWVIDVGGRTLLLWSAWTARTPREEVRDLLDIVDSVEVHAP